MSFQDRAMEEYSLLSIKIDKLQDFIVSDKYDPLPEIDRSDLKEQLKHMKGYFSVLSRRVSRQCGNG